MSGRAKRMDFLVRIDFRMCDVPADELAPLLAAEDRRARELIAEGTLVRIWRVPGTRANVGLWSAPSAGALHDALASLPLWPWFEISVEPLAEHPLEMQGAAGRARSTGPARVR